MFHHPSVPKEKYYLLQHFKGWLIETAVPVFEDGKATLMDFRVSQRHGTTFVYVLPLSPNRVLVEYTLFTGDTLPRQEYDIALGDYIRQFLSISEYKIIEEEFGIIPMTNINFPTHEGRIINVGTAGGQTKASSGYTFNFIQKHAKRITEHLLKNEKPISKTGLFDKRFRLYDSTLLNILTHNKLGGDQVFADLFKKNEPARVLRFLDNESSLEDELNIMGSVPSKVFIKAALQELFR
jgi:lycopene beta-cyclase